MSTRNFIPTLVLVATFVLLVACQRGDATSASSESKSEITLGIIKPNAVRDNHIGAILAKIEKSGLRIDGLRMVQLTQARAQEFYAVHRERPFYNDLVAFMSSGPVIAVAIEGSDAVSRFRELVGATDPAKAAPGTIRQEFAKSVTENAIHGSDSTEAAASEIAFFFNADELFKQQ